MAPPTKRGTAIKRKATSRACSISDDEVEDQIDPSSPSASPKPQKRARSNSPSIFVPAHDPALEDLFSSEEEGSNPETEQWTPEPFHEDGHDENEDVEKIYLSIEQPLPNPSNQPIRRSPPSSPYPTRSPTHASPNPNIIDLTSPSDTSNNPAMQLAHYREFYQRTCQQLKEKEERELAAKNSLIKVQYRCATCHEPVWKHRLELLRCERCGGRALWKIRTKRVCQFEAR